MGRDPRYLPRPGALVELTQRTIQRRCLLRPSPEVNRIVVGVLARAQQSTGMPVHAVSVLSTHLHILGSPSSVEQMANFMRHANTNLSKEVGRLHDWRGPMFDRRYTSIPVSDEPEAQIARLRYLLAQGTKENLVLAPADWPGVHSIDAILDGEPLRGTWVDRTRRYAASRRGGGVDESAFQTTIDLTLTPLPCWAHLAPFRYRELVRELVDPIDQETIARHRREETAPRGAGWVLRRHPHERPPSTDQTPRPRFHAASKRVRDALAAAFRAFVVAYQTAAERLRAGEIGVRFPENCFPPRLPFVPGSRLEPG